MRQRKFAALLMAVAWCLIATPVWSQDAVGTISSASGSVTVLQGSQVRPAQAGMQLLEGDRIVTGRDSYAEIKLRDETALALGPGGRLRISRFRFDAESNSGNMLLTLIKGALRVTTGLIGRRDPSAVQIRTLVGTVGIRGTQFIVEAGDRD